MLVPQVQMWSKSVKQNTCDTVETTEAETKKQRYSGDFLNVKKK